MKSMVVFLACFCCSTPAFAQRRISEEGKTGREHAAQPEASTQAPTVSEAPVVTHHAIIVNGKTLKYTATVAQMPIYDAAGETEAHIFYMAYTLDDVADRARRPVTFAFNGGPGSASIWLHMGALGPRRVKLLDKGEMPEPPFELVDNEQTWLGQTDLVFIDPVGTGFSRAKTPEIGRKFNGVKGDLQSIGEFIRMYLTRNDRWLSPLFIAGESYGTFRGAGLASTLVDKGIAINGLVMISTVLDFRMLDHNPANGLAFALRLPTFTAAAWYHKKLPVELQKDLRSTLKESEHWAMTDYLNGLNQGSSLNSGDRKRLIAQMARYTGLSPSYVDQSELRIDTGLFTRELLRDRKLTIGAYDARLTGPSPLDAGEYAEIDPSMSAVMPPFNETFLHYVRSELGYKTDVAYGVLNHVGPWDWDASNDFAEASSLLRNAMMKNPHLKVLVCAGYFDLVTPFYSVDYTLDHLQLQPEMQKRITREYYEAGHMMYIDSASRDKLTRDFAEFVRKSLPPR